jgi:type II secretory pathway component PulM
MSIRDKISESIAPMRGRYDEWLSEREPREILLLKIVTPLVVLFLLYSFAWTPMLQLISSPSGSDNQQIEQNWPQILSLTARLQALNNAGFDLRNMQKPTKENILAQFKSAGLANTSNQIKFDYDDNGATVSIKSASFDHLLQVLNKIHLRNGLQVTQFSAKRTGPGLANVNFTLGK